MTEEQLLAEKEKTEWIRTIYYWKRAHLKDYEVTPEHDEKIVAYFNANQLPLTYESLDKAFVALKAQGETFVTVPPEIDEFLAYPLPKYMPDIRTKGDINRVPHEDYKKFMTGKHKVAWQARVNFIQNRPVRGR
jgi:hypothetical protein